MNLPNLSGPVRRWQSPRVLKRVDKVKDNNFTETEVVTVIPNFQAMIQVADKEQLNPASIDWSREYLWIHSLQDLPLGYFIEYKGKDYKLVKGGGGWSDYGYCEVVGEETKLPLKVVTP